MQSASSMHVRFNDSERLTTSFLFAGVRRQKSERRSDRQPTASWCHCKGKPPRVSTTPQTLSAWTMPPWVPSRASSHGPPKMARSTPASSMENTACRPTPLAVTALVLRHHPSHTLHHLLLLHLSLDSTSAPLLPWPHRCRPHEASYGCHPSICFGYTYMPVLKHIQVKLWHVNYCESLILLKHWLYTLLSQGMCSHLQVGLHVHYTWHVCVFILEYQMVHMLLLDNLSLDSTFFMLQLDGYSFYIIYKTSWKGRPESNPCLMDSMPNMCSVDT